MDQAVTKRGQGNADRILGSFGIFFHLAGDDLKHLLQGQSLRQVAKDARGEQACGHVLKRESELMRLSVIDSDKRECA